MINFENLDKFTFPGVGKYDIPQIEPVKASAWRIYPCELPLHSKRPGKQNRSFLCGRLPIHSILEHAGQVHSETVAVCGGVCAGLLHIHGYAAGDADIQPLPQALVGGILANARHDGLSNDFMERRA